MAAEHTHGQTDLTKPTAMVTFLLILAITSIVLGLGGGLTVLAVRSFQGQIDLATVMWMAVCFMSSSCLSGVLWALGWLCRSQYHHARTEERIISALERLSAAGAVRAIQVAEQVGTESADSLPAGLSEAILEQLRELNCNLLLSEPRRQLKWKYLTEESSQRLIRQLEHSLGAGDLVAAEKVLDRLVRLVPDSPEIPALRERIETTRCEAMARAEDEADRQVNEFMAAGDFVRAGAVAETLGANYPDSARASELIGRVHRERDAFVTEQRLAMFRRIEKAAADRHWQSALQAAGELLEAYPNSPEADTVRTQLPTITDNAQIEEVRRLRDRIRDLITRRRFGEAIEAARDIIERFPQSAAAAELSQQMPKLEELAKSERESDQ